MRQEKFICSFVFELSGFRPKAVAMERWLPFWIKEDDCSHWKKVSQKWEVTLHCQKRWSKVSVSSLQKVQRSLSLIPILYKKEFVGRRLWRNLNWKIIILVLFVHVLVSWNVFFQSISSSLRLQSLYHFVWEALGFSLFVATRQSKRFAVQTFGKKQNWTFLVWSFLCFQYVFQLFKTKT